jgi:hypothetical protein
MLRCFCYDRVGENASTSQRFNPSTLQPFNLSTLQQSRSSSCRGVRRGERRYNCVDRHILCPLPSALCSRGPKLLLRPSNLHHRQRKPQPQLLFQVNFYVMNAELLKLHPAKIVNVGGVTLHFL